MALTDKQVRFCEEYLIDLNATQAAIRAGYSEKTAKQIASENLAKPDLHAYIAELQQKRSQRTEITSDFVLSGLKEVAERCLQKSPVLEWDHVAKGLVQKRDGDGNNIWEFDSTGANRSFELLGKHLGLFEKDNEQKKPIVNVSTLANDELKQLEALLSKANGG